MLKCEKISNSDLIKHLFIMFHFFFSILLRQDVSLEWQVSLYILLSDILQVDRIVSGKKYIGSQ